MAPDAHYALPMESSEGTASSAPWSTWSHLARTAIGYASGVTAAGLLITYVVGFVIVNYYLASFGVRELDPIRPRYVAASVPFIGLLVLTIFVLYEVQRAIPDRFSQPGRLRRWFAWIVRVIGAAAAGLLLVSLLMARGDGVAWDLTATMIAFAASVAIVADNLRAVRATGPRIGLVRNAYFALATTILAISVYATGIYPNVPTWIGGGQPDDVQLAVSGSVAAVCPECAAGAVVKLIDEESTRIVVLVVDAKGTRAIEISRSEVQVIAHRAKSGAPR